MSQPNQSNAGKDGKNGAKPKTDDSLLLWSITLILIVAQTWLYTHMRPQTVKPRAIISGTQADALQNAVGRDLTKNRDGFETFIRNYLSVSADSQPIANKDSFSDEAWSAYQGYIARRLALLQKGQTQTVEFVYAGQKYVDMVEEYSDFTAVGLFCYDSGDGPACGTEKFRIHLLVQGDMAVPARLKIHEWQVEP